jgi:SAM-dependent methyltransferase
MLRSDAPEHVRHYLDDARSAMSNLEESLAAAGRSFDDVEACLDFAAGYGRVTRHLVLRLGPERVTVCDVDPRALRFCVREFGVAAQRSPADVRRLALHGTYDLIFVGSLLTHLRPADGMEVLARLDAALRGGDSLPSARRARAASRISTGTESDSGAPRRRTGPEWRVTASGSFPIRGGATTASPSTRAAGSR